MYDLDAICKGVLNVESNCVGKNLARIFRLNFRLFGISFVSNLLVQCVLFSTMQYDFAVHFHSPGQERFPSRH